MVVATSKNRQRTLASSLERLFGAKSRVAVLRVFVLDPLRPYYQRQLEAATGLPIRAVQRELIRLTEAGFLYRRMEGNRAYYHIDQEFALFAELRAMFMKAATPKDLLRGSLALDPAVRQLFLAEGGQRALVVTHPGKGEPTAYGGGIPVQCLSTEAFLGVLRGEREVLEPFLALGEDLLGRREDVLWRSIEEAEFTVQKGAGVP